MQYIGRIQFGFGALKTLGSELALLGVARPLIMADAGVRAAGLLQAVIELLHPVGATRPYICGREPTEEAARLGRQEYLDQQCDGIVAVGGGAVIDLAKVIALITTHPGPLAQYSTAENGSGKIRSVNPVVCIPTTAGTGSEVGRGAGVALGDGGSKAIFSSINLIPKVAICDPELTVTLPRHMTAGSGIDALGHCVEAYLSPVINPPIDAIALDGIERVAASLENAVKNPSDRDARWNMMMAALEGGMSFWKGLGPAHALSIPLDNYGLHHGTTVGMLLPEVLRFVRPSVPRRMERLDAIFGNPVEDALHSLNRSIGLPQSIRKEVPSSALDSIAAAAADSFFNTSSARRGTAADYRGLLEAIY